MAERLPTNAALGRIVGRWRVEHSVSQERLGLDSGISPKHVSRLELAKQDPTLGTVTKLLDAIGMSWAEFGELVERERAGDG